MNQPFVVTIGRQMGSGGRELGRLLAERLGVDFYDKKLLLDAAKNSGLIAQTIENADERTPSFLSSVFGSALGQAVTPVRAYSYDDTAYRAVSDTIRELGQTKSCVIVGRTADYVLRNHPRCISLFIHAPEEACIKRVMARGERLSEADARSLVRKTNKLRAAYYGFFTDRNWGAAPTYDLTIDSSLLPLPQLADLLADYIKRRISLWQDGESSDKVARN